MRQWLVLLIATFAVLGLSLPAVASQRVPGIPSPTDFGIGLGDLPTNGDDDNAGPGNGNDDADDEDEADDDDGDEDDEDDFEEKEREVKVEIDEEEQKVLIELESKGAARKDEVKVRFEAPEGEMKVSFEVEAEQGTEVEVELRVTFRRIVEFLDTINDGDGAFTVGEEIVQSFPVETLKIEGMSLTVNPNDGTQVQVKVVYCIQGIQDCDGPFRFSLTFDIFGVPTEVNDVSVGPTRAKILIEVTDFPFGTDPTRHLALELEFRTEFELELRGTPEDDAAIRAEGEGFVAFFEPLLEMATVDIDPVPVKETILRQRMEVENEEGEEAFEERVRLFFAYPPGNVVHDPIVGIMTVAAVILPGAPLPSILAYVVGLGTALLLVMGVWALNRRRP